MSNADSEFKHLTLIIIISAIVLIPGIWKLIDWINYLGWVEVSIYLIISVSSVLIYKLFNFFSK